MKKMNLENVPNKSGIYLWKDEHDNVLYVGKAKKLKLRMKQYFKGMLNSYKTSALISKIHSFDYIITQSDKEALLLEKNYIDKYNPPFNILLKDDKRYPYIKISLNKKLEIQFSYKVKESKNTTYFGPYPRGYGLRHLKYLLDRLTLFDKGLMIKNKDIDFWIKQYKKACKILSNDEKGINLELKQKIKEASNNMQYELANELNKSLISLIENKEKQIIEISNNKNIDVFGIVQKKDKLSINILFFRNKYLLSKKDYILTIFNTKEETIKEFVEKYYWINKIPDLIITDVLFDFKVKIESPIKGKKKKILEMAKENAEDNIEMKIQRQIRKEKQISESINLLEKITKTNIKHILMIDNSSTNNHLPISVIVSYRNGRKQKKEYRKYNLVETNRKADVEYIKQGIEKYFNNPLNHIPDIFIVDGGVAQVNEARKIIQNIPVIGLSKDEKHRTKNIIDLKNNIIPISNQFLLNFLSGMQIEVDRFAKYHYNQRKSKKSLANSLTQIKGIGDKIEKKLLNHFKNYASIYNATKKELELVVSKKNAENIKNHLKKK